MIKSTTFSALLMVFFYQISLGQPPTNRYQNNLFPNFVKTNNVLFSTAVPQPTSGGGFYEWVSGYPLNADETETTDIDLFMNIYEPEEDTLSTRPLVIICFGGGFLYGSKDHWSIQLLCEDLAKKGFVTAAIDYRLGMNIFDEDLCARSVYRAVQDLRSAVRFFRADAASTDTYKIDPNQIFVGGHSAGAFTALHNVFLNKESERPISTFQWTQGGTAIPDLMPLDSVGNNKSFNGEANSVFSLAGAVGFLSYIESNADSKIVSFHSTDDGTVPYDLGEPFGDISGLIFGSDLPTVYGSHQIALRADTIGLSNQFNSYTNRGHGVHENGETTLYPDIVDSISNWFYQEELKPNYTHIVGDTVICKSTQIYEYQLAGLDGSYFDWQLIGGTWVEWSNYSNTVSIQWDTLAPAHSLSVIPYSALDAKGDSLSLEIEMLPFETNLFNGDNNNWEETSNWSLSELPGLCSDVIFDANLPIDSLQIMESTQINSILIPEFLQFHISEEVNFNIHQQNVYNTNFALDVQGEIINHGKIYIKSINEGLEISLKSNASILNTSTSEIRIQ